MPKLLHTPADRATARAARSLALPLCVAGLLAACGNDTGIPHPDPLWT